MKRFTTDLSVLVLTLMLASAAFAQNVIDYSFANSTDAYTDLDILGDTLATATYDDAISAPTNIGFTFRYAGTNYTQFRLNTNGWITFDVGASSTTNYTPLSGTVASAIAGFSRDLDGSFAAGTQYRVHTSGVVGSRITKIQFRNLRFFTGAGNFRFQIWLYETSNRVEIRYGANTFPTTAQTVQVGLKGGTSTFSTNSRALYGQATGPFNWTSPGVGVNGATTMDVTLAVPPAGSVAAIPDSGRVYAFTPPATGALLTAYTIDNSLPTGGSNYASFAEAFAALNTNGVSGPTTFTVTGSGATVTYNEANLTLGGVLPSGANTPLLSTLSSTNTLTFVNGAGQTINLSGQGTSLSDFAIRLAGVRYVTFNGINVIDTVLSRADSTQRRLEYGYILTNASNERGSTNNTIQNFSLDLQRTNPTVVSYGVIIANSTSILGTVTGTAGAVASRNNNNVITSFTIRNVKRGVQLDGLPYPAYDEGNQVSGPAFTSATGGVWTGGSRVTNFGTSSAGTDYGVGIDGQKDLKVFNIQIDGGIEANATPALSGIHFGTAASTSDGVNNVEIYNCVIRDLQNNVGTTAAVNGIRASGTTLPHTVKIYNTAIYDLRSTTATGANVLVGIQLTSSVAGNRFELYNNSINITGVTAALGTAKGIGIDGNLGTIIIAKNNAISVTGGGATGGAVGVFGSGATGTFLDFSNNVYDVGTTSAARRVANYPTTVRQNLIDWQSALGSATIFSDGIDQRSAYGAPGFASSTNLTYGAANRVNNSGVAISGLSTANDILGVARGANPDVGVFEGGFSAGFVDAASAGIAITPLEGSVSAEIRVIVTDNRQGGAGTDSLKARLWYRGAPFTGAFASLSPDLAPADSGNGEYRWGTSLRALASGTYQYYIIVRDSAGNSFASPTMVAGGVAPGFTVDPAGPGYLGANPFTSAGVRTFQNAGAVLAFGTYSVGPTGTYPNLTAVAAEVNSKPLSGSVIFEMQGTYTGAGEVYPIVFNQPSYTVAGPLTITIRPDSAVVTPLLTAGIPVGTNPLIVLDGMRDMTIDGRPGGVGVASMWTFRNAKDSAATNNCGPTFALVNDASRNTLRYLQIQGNASVLVAAAPWVGLGINAGVVSIGGTFYGGKGNNNNTVDNCEIMNNPAGAVAVPPNPLRGVISFGTINNLNSNNTFSNNKIRDFFSPITASAIGIQLQNDGGSTITGNSFYQTAPRTTTVSIINIFCNTTLGAGWTITNNFIGGTAPNAGGGPLIDSVLAAGTGGFQGIRVDGTQNTSGTTISGNVIRNISLRSASTAAVVAQFAGMLLFANQQPVLVQDNIIGDNTVDAGVSPSISIATSASVTHSYFGIFSGNGANTGGALTIRRNQIGGVRVTSTGTLGGAFTGILNQFTGGPVAIDSNLVGSATVPNNIVQNSNAVVVGMQGTSPIGQTSVNGNVIANITLLSAASATASTFTGMTFSASGTYTMTNNVVRNITSNSNSASSHLGIITTTAGLNNLIRGNMVHDWNFSPFTPATATNIFGIAVVNAASTGSMVNNRVYNIVNASTSTGGGIFGIANQGGLSWTYLNNMVSLGAGSSGDINIHGMQELSGAAGPGEINYVYNSVWISGAVPTGGTNTYAFRRSGAVNGATVSVRNNIFQNDRSGLPGNARGFAIGNVEATGANGWLATSSDRNLLRGNTDSVAQWLGVVAANNRTLAGWQAAQPGGSGGDANSKVGNAQFTSPADLHVNTGADTASAAANMGAPSSLTTVDFDGDARSGSTPDAGFDEFVLPAPAAFALTSPADAATGQPLSVSLNWTPSTQVASYDLYIGVGSVPVTPTVTGITGTSYIFAAAPSSTYHWNVRATNGDAQTASSNGPRTFVTISPPNAPSGLTATPTGPIPPPEEARIQAVYAQADAGLFATKEQYLAALNEARGIQPGELRLESSVSGVNLSWTDNAPSGPDAEDSFYVYAKLNSPPAVGGHSSPDFLAAVDSSAGSGGTVLYTHGPLGLNQNWHYKVTAKNAQGESGFSGASTTTFVNTPGAPTFSDVRWNRMRIHVDINGNAGTTETYAIRNTQSGLYVSATGTISSATAVWRTYAAWGGVGGQLLTGLSRGTAYTFEVKARNAANVETAFGPTGSQATTFDQPLTALTEDFTSVAFPPAGWTLQDEVTVRWLRSGVAPYASHPTQANGLVGPAAVYNFYDASAGEIDTLITPTLNLVGSINASLTWHHAYRSFVGEADSVFLLISSDGGSTWNVLLADGFPNMSTVGNSTARFTPSASSQWRENSIDIPAIYHTSSVRIGWRGKSAFGNNYWLDNVSLVRKVGPNTIIVRKYADADGSFGTAGDRTLKAWYLTLDSLGGAPIASGTTDSLYVANLLDGTYVASEADSIGWYHIGKVRNGAPVATTVRHDTIVVAGGGVVWITDFVNTNVPPSAPPVVNAPIAAGATSVSGTSSEADLTVIDVYVNNVSVGTTAVTSGLWNKTGLTALIAGQTVKATATAPGKTVSAFSNEVTVQNVSDAPIVNSPIAAGATAVSGTSTEADLTVIDVYVDNVSVGTTAVTSGLWNKTGLTALTVGQTVKATATAPGELESGFSNVVTVQAATVNVTFRVNMSPAMQAGLFRPDLSDVVEVRGSFNGWAGDAMSDGDADSIYTVTKVLTIGATENFKYFKTMRGGVDYEEFGGNRSVTIGANDTTLDVVYFSNFPEVRVMTFQVNMNVKILESLFDPNTDFVTVRGNFNDWGNNNGNADQLSDGDSDGIYTIVKPITGPRTVDFKYWSSSTLAWENMVDNRQFTWPTADSTLPVVFFNNDPGTRVFSVAPASVNFGSVATGDSASGVVWVHNTGSGQMEVTSVVSDDAAFTVLPANASVGGQDSASFTLKFKPVLVQAYSGNIVFSHDAAGSPDTVAVSGTGVSVGPSGGKFLSVTVDTLAQTVAGKFPKPVKRAKPGKPIVMPNWANLMSEGVAQGAFAPGTLVSDSAGGAVIGVSHMFNAGGKWKPVVDSAKVMGWVRLTKWNFNKGIGKGFNIFQKTLNAKGTKHTGGPSGFDLFANAKPFVKEQKKLVPKKQNNVMFAELTALKFNIAMSALEKTPAGFGELIFERTGNQFDQMSVLEIAQRADSMMTYHGAYVQVDYDSLLSTVSDINLAFVGGIDTLSWMATDSLFLLGKLRLKGQVDIDSVSYLKLPSPFRPSVTTPSSYEVESEEDTDFGDDEEFENLPIAAKLYQNYPNPFNPSTTVSFRLREDSKVSLNIYNMLGQEVATLLNNEELEEGVQMLQFNASGLTSGVYFYRIQAEGLEGDGFKTVETGKMVLLK